MDEPRRVCSRCGESYDPEVIFCPKDGTPLGSRKTEVADDPYLDIAVGGQFRIEQLIGIGAMGRVYRAHQAGIDRDVAIKILHRDLLRNPTVIGRFHREARVASRLAHPNVVQVLMTGDLGRMNADVGGEAYLVMEFLDGISLRSALAAAGGAMPLPRALHVILQVCDAVGEAHAQGIVHRDLKPENVMLVRRGDDPDFVKVLDFGVARLEWSDNSVATQAGVIFGTARYISPEGAQGAKVGPPSDVYSIATMLFQCLSGQTPFDGESPVSILIKHTNEAPPDVRSVARSSYVPEPIARAIAANLAKSPADRCRDAREFGRALVEAARDSGLKADGLVARSTLLGSDPALKMASIERTRTLNLDPDLAERMAGRTPRSSSTEFIDPRDSKRTEAHDSDPTLSDAPLSSRTTSGASASRIEPTIADEPSRELLSSPRTSSAPLEPSMDTAVTTSVPPSSTPLSAERSSLPEADWAPEPPTLSVKRLLSLSGLFVLGAALALLVAVKLGAFNRRGDDLASYAARANAAIEAQAWDRPPGDNVKDITDAALARWPGAPEIFAVRRKAARLLTTQAQGLRASDVSRAERLARLALELDSNNDQARSLLASLTAPATSSFAVTPALPSATARSEERHAPRFWERRHHAAKSPEPEHATPPTNAADAGAAPAAPVPSGGGRWL
jgi:eukaryotic-like serine/threonine-protein kinase